MVDSYPEYLNPFAEDVKPRRKLSIRDSFRDIKRSIRQSFRGKKKQQEDVTLRQKNEADTFHRVPVSYPAYRQPTEALPRSRFQQRLSKQSASNPFEEEEDKRSTMVKRRGKKRAPLPPKSFSNQQLNRIPGSADSSWSLTSVDTEYSGTTDISRDHDLDTDTLEKIKDFNKNMEMLQDDTNNNVIKPEKSETEANNNIPDLVVSCPSETNETNETDEVKEIVDNTKEMNLDKENNEDVYLYHEKKSLYIAGSTDQLNDSNLDENDTYTGRVSLYITGSNDTLGDKNEDNVSENKETMLPIPKQRKNKLSKVELLGV